MRSEFLWPCFALVALIFTVWGALFVGRLRILRVTKPQRGDFATQEAQIRFFAEADMARANLGNLFEMPVLFFALLPLLALTQRMSDLELGLAWVFVASRYAHSWLHIVTRDVRWRARCYLASCLVLAAMWIAFAIEIARG
jgi:hypothetical protein